MLLVKLPVPESFVVLFIVGFGEVPQQTPLAVIVAQPSFVMVPPLEAVVCVMELITVVVIVGTTTGLTVMANELGVPSPNSL